VIVARLLIDEMDGETIGLLNGLIVYVNKHIG
jgi:hypothetical protein